MRGHDIMDCLARSRGVLVDRVLVVHVDVSHLLCIVVYGVVVYLIMLFNFFL